MQPLAQLLFRDQEQRKEFGDIGADNKGRFFERSSSPLIVCFSSTSSA
jgi:hypothetical protein